MPVAVAPQSQQLFLDAVSWDQYARLLDVFSDRPGVRLTYDRGRLEIMTLSAEHEGYGYMLGRMVDTLTEELELPLVGGGSTTLQGELLYRGLEPDNCFWIKNATSVRGLKKWRMGIDPPPDLAIEVDVTHSSVDRMAIYAVLGVPEVWRLKGGMLGYYTLDPDQEYARASRPSFAPFLDPVEVGKFLKLRTKLDDNGVIRRFRTWVRERIEETKRPGRFRNGRQR